MPAPLLPRQTAAPPKKKAPAKKAAPKKPAKKAAPLRNGRAEMQKEARAGQSDVDWGAVVRRAVEPPVDLWNAVRPYTPAPTVKKAVKKATPAPARLTAKAAQALDTGIGTSIDVAARIPRTLTTPIHPGATHTPVEDVKDIGASALAQRISKPHVKVGTAYLSPQYQQFFKGEDEVSADQVTEAMHTLSAGVRKAPAPFTDDELRRRFKMIEDNGYDLRDAKHWTLDDVIAKSLHKNEKSIMGYIRNTAAGGVQLASLPSGIVAGASAGISALGGNTKPAEQFGSDFAEFTRNSLPFVGNKSFFNELYENTPAVLANLIPATKGVSAVVGKAMLKAGERDIHLPGVGPHSESVPADLLKRGAFEVRKSLIEKGKAPGAQAKIEKGMTRSQHVRAELERDSGMMPVQQKLGTAARKTRAREGAVPFAGRLTGGTKRVHQIVELETTGMSPADYVAWKNRNAKQFRFAEAKATAAAAELRRQAHQHEIEGEPGMAAALRDDALKAEGEANQAAIYARQNEEHARFMTGAKPVAAEHPLATAVREGSAFISKNKLASGALKPTDRIFGDIEAKLRASADEVDDPQLHQAARNDNPDLGAMLQAQDRLRRATEARDVIRTRDAAYDASTVAKARRRGEDTAGRSHAEREARGGEKEVVRATGREIGHIDSESDRLNRAQRTHDERVPPTIAETPYTAHPGVSESESAKIKSDLDNIAELHINAERHRRSGIRTRIGTLRHQLTDPDITPERRARYEGQIKDLTGKLNTPSPRVIAKVQREVDAYLKRFGTRITERERRRYQAKYIVKTALVRQATGDLHALTSRERKLETRQVQERANSSRTWKGEADRLSQEYASRLGSWQRRYGGGVHATLRQAPIPRGKVKGFTAKTAQGVLPRVREPKIYRSEGSQLERAAYSPERTIQGIFHDIRSTADQVASTQFRNELLRTDLVQSAVGREGHMVPAGWHWVSEDNLQRWTNHPLHAGSEEEVAKLTDSHTGKLLPGIGKQLAAEIKDARTTIHATIPPERGYLIRESALEAIESAVERHDAGDFGVLLKITNEYRKALLFMLPRTFVNNMIGNVGLALLSGATMADIIRASHLLKNHPEVIPSHVRNRGLIASQFSPDDISGGWMDFWRRANTFAEDLGQAATYVSQLRGYGKAKGLKLYGKDGLLRGMDDMSSAWHRVAQDLATGKDPNVIRLMKRSKQFFGDVAKQTRVNKGLAVAVLFHRWLGHIVRLVTLTLPLHYPGRYLILQRIAQIGDDYRKQHGVLPDWAQGVVRLPWKFLGDRGIKTPNGIQQVVAGLSTTGLNPGQSYAQVADLGTDANPIFPGLAIAGGALSPVLSVPLQASTGINFQTGRPFTDRRGNPMTAASFPALAGHLTWQNAPVLNTLASTANTSGDSQLWDQAPSASSPAAYRRQQAYPWTIHASSPKGLGYVALRAVGLPITQLDSYGPRYNIHIHGLAAALASKHAAALAAQAAAHAKDEKKAPPSAEVTSPGPQPKALTPAQRKKAQREYASKVRAKAGGGGAAAIRARQKAYADKVKSGSR